jgi:hypothetical protein
VLFDVLPDLVNRHLTAPDPIVVHYTINPAIQPPERPTAWDMDIKMEDTLLKSKMSTLVHASKESSQTLAKMDEEVKILKIFQAAWLTRVSTDCTPGPVTAQFTSETDFPRIFLQGSCTLHTNMARIAIARP